MVKAIGTDSLGQGATEQIVVDLDYPSSVIKDIDEIIAQGGDVELEEDGADNSSINIPTGSLEDSSSQSASVTAMTAQGESHEMKAQAIGGLASLIFKKQSVAGAIDDIVGEIYEVSLENAVIKSGKKITLNIAYDRSNMETETGGDLDLSKLNIRRKNVSTGEWEVVEGVISHDSANGLVSLEVNDLNSASAVSSQMSAQAVTQIGTYAVFYGIPSNQGSAENNVLYSGGKFRVYNFPNPFDLKEKNVTLSNTGTNTELAGTLTIDGTVIKYYLQGTSGNNSDVKFRIYNIAGELVRTINEGDREKGFIYFTEWDGKNDGGSKCASGVYMLLSEIDGDITGDVVKMAIIK
jgi:flagellar hook assembly protein FlgD